MGDLGCGRSWKGVFRKSHEKGDVRQVGKYLCMQIGIKCTPVYIFVRVCVRLCVFLEVQMHSSYRGIAIGGSCRSRCCHQHNLNLRRNEQLDLACEIFALGRVFASIWASSCVRRLLFTGMRCRVRLLPTLRLKNICSRMQMISRCNNLFTALADKFLPTAASARIGDD